MADRDLARELRDARETYGLDSPEARAAFDARLAEVAAQEAVEPLQWWILAFSHQANGEPLGVVILRARGISTACSDARERGINPGGQVTGAPIGEIEPGEWTDRWANRLIAPGTDVPPPPPHR